MKKVLFTHSYFLRFDPKQWTAGQPYAPLGTLYAASLLRENGHPVSIFDTMFARKAKDVIPVLEKENPDIFIVYDDGFNYLTKMCLQNMRSAAFDMIRCAKERGCTVIVSSSDSTDHYEMFLNQGADYILIGEAELTLLELMKALDKPGSVDLHDIAGIVFKSIHGLVKTRRRDVLKDLDSLPFPAWDIIDMNPYRQMWLRRHGHFSINMATTRGCPFKCNWCAKPIYGNRYNSRSPQQVVREIQLLKKKFDLDHIWFCDDIFGLKPGWIKEFADLIQAENLIFSFKMQGRADLLLEENNIRNLRRAGCDNVWMGAESGSQRILDAMDKGITVEQIHEATHLLKKHSIRPSLFIQFGYLTETKDDIEKTIAMINALLPYEIGISVSYPLPGTKFFEKVKKDMREKTNWADSDELALLFRNTYQPAFYKRLHRYVHKSYRKHIAYETIRQMLSFRARISLPGVKKALSALYYLPAAYLDKQKLKHLEKPAPDYAC